MTKRTKKEDFEVDDWDFGSDEFNFDDFDPEVTPTKGDRSPMMQAAGAVLSGAKDTVLDTNTMKTFLKKSLPQEYGSTFTMTEQGVGLARSLYDDLEREMRPVAQEAKRVGKRILPAIKNFMPESTFSKLSDYLDEKSRDTQASQEELINTTINQSLASIFEAKSEQEVDEKKEAAVQKQVDDTIQAKRHREGMDVYGSMARDLSRLAQYQDKVTVNWQRKTLELQYRQYFLQREAFEEQKKTSALLQTNLEGILKNTGLPDFVKISKLESAKENLRNRFINSSLDGLLAGRTNFVKNFATNLRSVAKQRIMDVKDNFMTGIEMAGDLADAQELAGDAGIDNKELAANMVGGSFVNKGAHWLGKQLRTRTGRKVRNAGRRLDLFNKNLSAYAQRAAEEGWGENLPIIGGLVSMFNEATEMSTRRNNQVRSRTADYNPDEAVGMDYRMKTTVTDVIPGYLRMILQATQTQNRLYRAVHPETESIKDVEAQVFDHRALKFRSHSSMARRVRAALYSRSENRALTKEVNGLIEGLEAKANEKAEDGEKEAVFLTDEQKNILARRLLKMQTNNEVMSAYDMQQPEWFGSGVSESDRETLTNFLKLVFGEAVDPSLNINTEKGFFKRAKREFENRFTKDLGYDERDFGDFAKAMEALGAGTVRSKLAKAQELVDQGHGEELMRAGILSRSGTLDEQDYINKQYKGFSPTGEDRDYIAPSVASKKTLHVLEQLDRIPVEERIWRNSAFRRLAPELKKLDIKRYSAYLEQHGLEDRVGEDNKVTKLPNGKFSKGGFTGFQYGSKLPVAGTLVPYQPTTQQMPVQFTGYTGTGAKYGEAGKVHYGEVVWSQEDTKRMGGVANVELLRQYGISALNRIKSAFDSTKATAKEFLANAHVPEIFNKEKMDDETSYVSQIAQQVTEIRDILKAGIPVSTFTQGETKFGQTQVPWYLRSFGSVIGDLAALPFKAVGAATKGTYNAATWVKNKTLGLFSSKWAKNVWKGATNLFGTAKSRTLKLKDKYADRFDVWVKGEVKPRLTRFALLNGQYANSEGKPITSWKEIDKNGVYQLNDQGVWECVLPPFDLANTFVINYETGKNVVLSAITTAKDWVIDRAKDIRSGMGMVTGLIADTTLAAAKMAKNQIFKPVDVYVKDKVQEGPRLLAIVMRRGGYYDKTTGKKIWNPADIAGEVIDEEGNLALSIADLKLGMVDARNKPLRTGFDKVTGWIGDQVSTAWNAVVGIGKGIKKGARSLFGGVKNFFAQFFGDGGVIFANSNALTKKLDDIYRLLDERLSKTGTRSDSDGDGIRDGSIAGLRNRNKLARLRKAEEIIRERKEAENRRDRARNKGRGKAFDPTEKIGDFFSSLKEKLGFGGDSDGDGINTDIGSRRDRIRDRARRAGRAGRVRGRRGLRNATRGVRNRAAGLRGRLPGRGALRGAGRLARRIPGAGIVGGIGKVGGGLMGVGRALPGSLKAGGAGLVLGGLSGVASAADMDNTATALDVASNAATLYSLGSMATGALGYGSLGTAASTAIGALGSGATTLGGMAVSAGGSIMTGLGTAGAFLLTNPIGWGILATAAIAAAGYGVYRYLKRNKLGTLGEYRYVQYGFPDGNKDWVARVTDVESYFEKDKLNTADRITLKDTNIDLKEFLDLFDVKPDQREQAIKVLEWYNKRFKPIFEAHLNALNQVKKGTKIHDIDDKLTKEEKLRYLQMVELPQGPYNVNVSPFDDLKELPSGADAVKAKYAKVKAELEKEKEGGGGILSTATDFAKTALSATPLGALAVKGYEAIKGKSEAEDKEKEQSALASKTAADLATPAVAAATTTYTSQTNDITTSKGTLSAFDAIILKAYGLRLFDQEKVSVLRRMERRVLEFVKLNPDKQAEFRGDIDGLKMELAPLFGIGKNDVTNLALFQHYFVHRFLTVLLATVSIKAKITNKGDVQAAMATVLNPNDELNAATEIISTNTEQGSYWNIDRGLWPDLTLNTEVSSTDVHINVIKARLTTKELNAETSGTQPVTKGDNGTLAATVAQQQLASQEKNQTGFWGRAASTVASMLPGGGVISKIAGYMPDIFANSQSSDAGSSVGNNLGQAVAGNGALNIQAGTGGSYSQVPQPLGKGWPAVKNTILAAAKIVGMDPGLMGAMAAQESGLDPSIKARTSSATGLFQFIRETWQGMMNKHASKYGIPRGTPPTDGAANALLGAAFMQENYEQLAKLNRGHPSAGDLYLSHFLGYGGARKALNADQNAIAAQVFPKEASANKGIFYRNGQPLTISGMRALLTEKMINSGKRHGVDIPISMRGGLQGGDEKGTKAPTDLTSQLTNQTAGFVSQAQAGRDGSARPSSLNAMMLGHATSLSALAHATNASNTASASGSNSVIPTTTSNSNPWAAYAGNASFQNQGGYVNNQVASQTSLQRAAVDAQQTQQTRKGPQGNNLRALLLAAAPWAAIGMTKLKKATASVNLHGMKKDFMTLLYAAIAEYCQKTGHPGFKVTSAFRTRAEQQALYNRNKSNAARPGTSRHESGGAIDLDNASVKDLKSGPIDKFFASKIPQKWGFHRPLERNTAGKVWEPWHVENKFFGRGGISTAASLEQGARLAEKEAQAQAQSGVATPVDNGVPGVAPGTQAMSAVPQADQQQDRWEAIRKGNTTTPDSLGFGEGTLTENIDQLLGRPSLTQATKDAQQTAQQAAEDARTKATHDILNLQLDEAKTTNKLLTDIHSTLKGAMQEISTTVTNVTSAVKEKPQSETAPTATEVIQDNRKRFGPQERDVMPKGSLTVSKRAYQN